MNVKNSVRLRLALEELGPTFIKIGQLLSTRADLLPKEYIEELSKLQDDVAPISGNEVVQIIEKELNIKVDEAFADFDKNPIAVASIGQVHQALLSTGEELAIKVKKPNIEPQINQDLEILQRMALFLEKKTSWGKIYNFSDLALELKKNILDELDYKNEGRNADRFHKNFKDNPNVFIPYVYWRYTNRNVLALEFKSGYHLNNLLEDNDNTLDRTRLAEAIVDAYFSQIFEHGFFHGDPHPGNIIILPPEKIMFVDFGTAGYISEDLRNKFQFILKSIIGDRKEDVTRGFIELGFAPENVNKKELTDDLSRLQDRYYHIPLDNIEIGEVLQEFIQISYKHNIHLPREFLLLVKALGILEGIVSRLDPDYKLINSLNKFGDAIKEDLFSRNQKQLKDLYFAYEKMLTSIPQNINKISEHVADGELKIKIEVVNTEPPLNRLGKIINRLSFSVVLASLIIGLAMIIDGEDFFFFNNYPVTEIALVGGGFLGIWWIYNLFRSEK